ncbi:MAG TPA: hypothetical protein VFK03_01725, partial [Candidatus Saccharimonadales bacterium]|nr:hypothetical protein [Candidatus Saccharimonadales bacterium]
MTIYKKSGLSLAVVIMLLAVSPLQAMADTANPPQGYSYDATTGLWQNGTYAWNPVTGQTTPLKSTDYSYNPETQHWDTNSYRYDSTAQKYVANQPPAPAAPLVTQSPAATTSSSQPAPTSLTAPTAKTTTQPTTDKSSSAGLFDNFYKASISNRFEASATSGDANVSHNTTAGSATSGQAMTTTTLINLLASSLSQDGKTPYTFITNILGNVFGDLTIDPGQLAK